MKALVPLDGSDTSLRVFATVRRLLAIQPEIEVHLFSVLDPRSVRGRAEHAITENPAAGVGSVNVTAPLPRVVESHGEAMERKARELHDRLADLARKELPAAATVVHTAWSEHTAQAIDTIARDLDADVIVMASHGRSGISHALAGSVTEAVIRSSARPVLVHGPAAV